MADIARLAEEPNLRQLEGIELLGVRINTLSVDSLVNLIEQLIIHQSKAIVAYANVHSLNMAYTQPQFRLFFEKADIVFCDGHGVRLGALLSGTQIPYRYTPPDWIPLLSELCVRRDFSYFFLGARPGVAEEAAKKIQTQFPSLRIAGTHHGYFNKTSGSAENATVIEKINEAKPNLVIVGFGMPLQEMWLMENWGQIEANVALTAGAVFDYVAGRVYRAPRWITDHGFEWLARLLVEPGRLWRRYLVGNPLFIARVLRERLLGTDSRTN